MVDLVYITLYHFLSHSDSTRFSDPLGLHVATYRKSLSDEKKAILHTRFIRVSSMNH